jgi:hypothetical protein
MKSAVSKLIVRTSRSGFNSDGLIQNYSKVMSKWALWKVVSGPLELWRVEPQARIPLAGQAVAMRYLFIIVDHLPIPGILAAHHPTEAFTFDYT